MLYSIKYKGFEKKVCVLQTVYISKIYKKISCTLKNKSDITKDLVVKRVKPLDAYIVSLPKRFDTLSTYGFSVDQELPDNPPWGDTFRPHFDQQQALSPSISPTVPPPSSPTGPSAIQDQPPDASPYPTGHIFQLIHRMNDHRPFTYNNIHHSNFLTFACFLPFSV